MKPITFQDTDVTLILNPKTKESYSFKIEDIHSITVAPTKFIEFQIYESDVEGEGSDKRKRVIYGMEFSKSLTTEYVVNFLHQIKDKAAQISTKKSFEIFDMSKSVDRAMILAGFTDAKEIPLFSSEGFKDTGFRILRDASIVTVVFSIIFIRVTAFPVETAHPWWSYPLFIYGSFCFYLAFRQIAFRTGVWFHKNIPGLGFLSHILAFAGGVYYGLFGGGVFLAIKYNNVRRLGTEVFVKPEDRI